MTWSSSTQQHALSGQRSVVSAGPGWPAVGQSLSRRHWRSAPVNPPRSLIDQIPSSIMQLRMRDGSCRGRQPCTSLRSMTSSQWMTSQCQQQQPYMLEFWPLT